MQVAFEKAHGALARGVVAERDVDVRIDQAGNGGHAAGIDDDVRGLHVGR